jgi:hypothetical protein
MALIINNCQFGPKIVYDGLILALDVANPKSYPGSGTVWNDYIGNYTGTLNNGVGFDSSNSGSFSFDGTNDYINLNFLFTQGSSENVYTVVMGAKLSSVFVGSRRKLWSSDNGGFDWGFGCGENGKFAVFSGENVHEGSLQDTDWHIFTAQWGSFGSKLYIDGELDVSTATIGYDSSVSPSINIGRNPLGVEYWHGNVSFALVYNRTLTESEIQQNFNETRSRHNI